VPHIAAPHARSSLQRRPWAGRTAAAAWGAGAAARPAALRCSLGKQRQISSVPGRSTSRCTARATLPAAQGTGGVGSGEGARWGVGGCRMQITQLAQHKAAPAATPAAAPAPRLQSCVSCWCSCARPSSSQQARHQRQHVIRAACVPQRRLLLHHHLQHLSQRGGRQRAAGGQRREHLCGVALPQLLPHLSDGQRRGACSWGGRTPCCLPQMGAVHSGSRLQALVCHASPHRSARHRQRRPRAPAPAARNAVQGSSLLQAAPAGRRRGSACARPGARPRGRRRRRSLQRWRGPGASQSGGSCPATWRGESRPQMLCKPHGRFVRRRHARLEQQQLLLPCVRQPSSALPASGQHIRACSRTSGRTGGVQPPS
jgi:hypothetical protein